MSIIQDYKFWKEAKKATEIARLRKDVKFRTMLKQISIPHFGQNVSIEEAFIKSAPNPNTKPQECKQYVGNYAHMCHAYPCFYVMHNPFDDKDKSSYTEEQVQRCMNNRADGTIYEAFCQGCPAFEDLVKYQMLYAQFKTAQAKQKAAKQKLLDNFIFWKQRTK